ncbi:hypothetical protein CFOL_v3_35890 [Cephalotus follicularis]|uniref:Uncharacterized protein n=1 Tax=Cephalotus follicularis TaxID=3775 RepID=A0A1Q3DJ70_CEPFO|nr:hypothetical protein CFOL_v3_35890 [Cephalotus follicularis]
MILKSGAITVPCRHLFKPNKCFASNINTEQLCAQLDQLHIEADNTRDKAKKARMRLMRLSEAAEKLRRQATMSVEKGKEDDARELLFQKKKVMQGMEKSKTRIELLDELSAKLNEAISLKETQLIGNVALDIEVDSEGDSSPVRIISPKQEVLEWKNKDKDFGPYAVKFKDDQKLYFGTDSLASATDSKELKDLQGSLSPGIQNEDNMFSSLRGISSYKVFLEHLDLQLNKIEAELVTILNVSTFVLGNEETSKNLRVQQTTELLESIRGIRQRIANIMHAKLEI